MSATNSLNPERAPTTRSSRGASACKAALAAVLVLGALAGCARPTGDFGRPERSYLNDIAMPAVGKARAHMAGEPVSTFNETDQEREMRDRVWRFLVSPNGRDWAYDSRAELQRTRLEPIKAGRFTIDRYYKTLSGDAYASSTVRFKRIETDAEIDIATLPATFDAVCAVIEIDRQRAVAQANLQLGGDVAANVAARKTENDQYIGWFVNALRYRYDSYSYALDHLLVETPHREAEAADRSLSRLLVFVTAAERGDFCGGAVAGLYRNTTTIPGRILIDNDHESTLPPK
jgi:hypothetical protein